MDDISYFKSRLRALDVMSSKLWMTLATLGHDIKALDVMNRFKLCLT